MAWNGSDNSGRARTPAAPQKKAPGALRGIVAGAAAVAIVFGGIFCFFLRDDGKGTVGAKGENSHTIADKGKTYKKLDEISRVKPRKEYATKPKSVEEALERVEEAQDPLKFEPMPTADGNPAQKRVFHTGTEQVLSWLCHVSPGDPPIPPPPIPECEMEKMAEILISKNEVAEDDSPEAANAKQMVDAAKKEMMKFIKEGGDPDDFMQYVFREQTKAFLTRNLALEMFEEMADGDPADAREFAIKANEKLAEQGIIPIPVPEEDAQDGDAKEDVQPEANEQQ